MSLATRLSAFAQAVGADIKSLNGKITYKGDWNAVTAYKKGDQVWFSNDLWLAVTNVSGAGDYPSSDSPSAWRLVTEGMPIGGDPGQILAKYGANAFETEWIDAPSGGGGGTFSSATAMAIASGAVGNVGAGAGWTNIPIGALVVEPDATAFSLAGGVVTIRDAGWYHASVTGIGTFATANSLYIGIDKDATPSDGSIANNMSGSATFVRVGADGSFKAAAGDKVYIHVWSPIPTAYTAQVTQFNIERIGGPKGDKGDIGGNALIPVDTWHVIGTAGEPAWQGTWAQVDAPRIPRFKKFPDGTVKLYGLVKSGVLGTAVFTLPVGYRPSAARSNVEFATESNAAFGSVYITPTGLVVPFAGTPAQYISLDGIEFDTETVTQMMVGAKGDKGDTGAIGGNATVPMDPWHVIGTAGEPAWAYAFWTHFSTVGFRKDPLGRVHLKGTVTNTAPFGFTQTLFTLPAAYWPKQVVRTAVEVIEPTSGKSMCQVQVSPTGVVSIAGYITGTVTSGSTGSAIVLDEVAFDTELVTQMPTGPKGDKGDTGTINGTAVKTLDTWHVVGAAGEPQLTAGYTMLDPIHFRKDAFGRIQMRGSFATCGPSGNVAFTLPVGYRPVQRVRTVSIQNQVATGQWEGQVNVNADGTVTVYYTGPGATAYVSLDQIEFDSGTVTELNVAIVGASQVAVPLEGWHTVGQAGEPAYQNGWGVGNQVIKFRKDPFGKVELIGSPTGGAAGTVIFALPVGYRPANSGYHDCLLGGGGATYVNVDATTGNVTSGFGASGAWLNNIHFDTGLVTTMPAGPKGDKGDPGGVDVLSTLNWNTAVTPGFYRSAYDVMGMVKTVNGPGDTLNPPPQAGVVTAHQGGALVQKVWDLSMQTGWTRYRQSDSITWSAWLPELTRPPLWTELMIGGATSIDGEERYFQNAAMKTLGLLWKFRYDATAPAGKPKWCFAGGASFYNANDNDNFAPATGVSLGGGIWGDAGPVGPSWTCPLQGDYFIEFGALLYANVAGIYAQMTMNVGGTIDTVHPIMHGNFGTGYADYGDKVRTNRYDNIGQEALVKAAYSSTPGVGGGYQKRYMKVTPIRVVM